MIHSVSGRTVLKYGYLPMLLLGLSAAVQGWSEGAAFLRYQRDAILLHGELWRLITAHFVHGTVRHWLLNSLGLLLVWAAYPGYFRRSTSSLFVVALAGSISLQLLLFSSEVTWYLGMSGVLHGLFAAWSLVELLAGRRFAVVPLGLVLLKVLYEQYGVASVMSFADLGLPVLVDAHLYGVVAGLVLAPLMYRSIWRSRI